MTTSSSKRPPSPSQAIVQAPVERIADVVRVQITRQEAAASRAWRTGAARPPRWLARMREAMRLVVAATEVHGKERYHLLAEAAKIVVALREPRAHRLTFQRAERLLEVAIGKLGGCAGCLAMGGSNGDKRLYARVKRAVNKADPIGLLRSGAPDDEYHGEIDEIASWLPEEDWRTVAQAQVAVHHVFVRWFGATLAGPRGSYRKLARELHALRPHPSTRAAEIAHVKLTPEEARAIFDYTKARLRRTGKTIALDPATRAKMKVLLGEARR